MALGGCAAIQNLYELKREKNLELFRNAELIITESNVNEIHNHTSRQKLPLELIYRDLSWFYKELYFLGKKVLVITLAECSTRPQELHNIINNIHKKFCLKYGFNFINMREYFEKKNLLEFGRRNDGGGHQFGFIMKELGNNIISSLNDFNPPKNLNIINDNPQFKICTPKDMKLLSGTLEEIRMHNSMYDETTFRLTRETKIQFPKEFEGYFPIGIHSWLNNTHLKFDFSLSWVLGTHTSLILRNKNLSFSKENSFVNQFVEIQRKDFKIDDKTIIETNKNNLAYTEFHVNVLTWHQNAKRVEYCDIVSFFLASDNELKDKEDLELLENLATLSNLTIELSKEYDFSHLIPPVEVYKEIIEEYCARMDPRKLAPLQNQIKALEQGLNFGTAKARIQNHLSYKLGQIMIRNSKSFFGLLKIPFLLIAVTLAHKEQEKAYKEKIKTNPKLALPPLESYLDYKEALKEKECFTYKLGQAFIKGFESWYKGGLVKFYFEAKALEREFKSKKAKQE